MVLTVTKKMIRLGIQGPSLIKSSDSIHGSLIEIYPGRKPELNDRYTDSNCNGISGVDSYDIPLEEKYCSSYQPKGVAVLGDSASAHFGVPVRWVRPTEFNETTFENLLFSLVNELDWPQISWATGMSDNCWSKDMFSFQPNDVDSIYKR